MSKKDNLLKGKMGEGVSVEYLKRKKYKILETNFRCKIGEIDIIAMDGVNIVFIEVKTRQNNDYGFPSESVTFHKQRKISKVALYYLQKHNLFDYNVRFDVIEIWEFFLEEIKMNHIVNAFEIIM